MSDLFLKYKKERENVESISVDGAFITYKFLQDYAYIEDVYCVPELRDSGIAHELAAKVEVLARKAGYKKMLGSVDTNATNPEQSLRACFNNGYKILNLQGSVIWLHKELK
jgi:hypothetical protein